MEALLHPVKISKLTYDKATCHVSAPASLVP
jgi:hypothetical protein